MRDSRFVMPASGQVVFEYVTVERVDLSSELL